MLVAVSIVSALLLPSTFRDESIVSRKIPSFLARSAPALTGEDPNGGTPETVSSFAVSESSIKSERRVVSSRMSATPSFSAEVLYSFSSGGDASSEVN